MGRGTGSFSATVRSSNYGDAVPLDAPSASNFNGLDVAAAIFATSDGGGYWVSSALGAVYGYGDASYLGEHDGNPSQRVHYRRHRLLTYHQRPAPEELFGLSSTDGEAASNAATKTVTAVTGRLRRCLLRSALRRMQLLQASGTTS